MHAQYSSMCASWRCLVANLPMGPLPFCLVRFQHFAISSRETKKLPNSTNSSLEWQERIDRVSTCANIVAILARSNVHARNIVVVIAVIDITMFTNNRD